MRQAQRGVKGAAARSVGVLAVVAMVGVLAGCAGLTPSASPGPVRTSTRSMGWTHQRYDLTGGEVSLSIHTPPRNEQFALGATLAERRLGAEPGTLTVVASSAGRRTSRPWFVVWRQSGDWRFGKMDFVDVPDGSSVSERETRYTVWRLGLVPAVLLDSTQAGETWSARVLGVPIIADHTFTAILESPYHDSRGGRGRGVVRWEVSCDGETAVHRVEPIVQVDHVLRSMGRIGGGAIESSTALWSRDMLYFAVSSVAPTARRRVLLCGWYVRFPLNQPRMVPAMDLQGQPYLYDSAEVARRVELSHHEVLQFDGPKLDPIDDSSRIRLALMPIYTHGESGRQDTDSVGVRDAARFVLATDGLLAREIRVYWRWHSHEVSRDPVLAARGGPDSDEFGPLRIELSERRLWLVPDDVEPGSLTGASSADDGVVRVGVSRIVAAVERFPAMLIAWERGVLLRNDGYRRSRSSRASQQLDLPRDDLGGSDFDPNPLGASLIRHAFPMRFGDQRTARYYERLLCGFLVLGGSSEQLRQRLMAPGEPFDRVRAARDEADRPTIIGIVSPSGQLLTVARIPTELSWIDWSAAQYLPSLWERRVTFLLPSGELVHLDYTGVDPEYVELPPAADERPEGD